jgi:hypothetical protein
MCSECSVWPGVWLQAHGPLPLACCSKVHRLPAGAGATADWGLQAWPGHSIPATCCLSAGGAREQEGSLCGMMVWLPSHISTFHHQVNGQF